MTNETFDPRDAAGFRAQEDALPLELRPMHQWLVEDGAAWRTHVATAEPVLAQTRTRLLAAAHTPDTAPAAPLLAQDRETHETRGPLPDQRPKVGRGAGRRAMLSTVAAVLLVGLLGAMLSSMASHRTGPTGTATATIAPSPTPLPNSWQAIQTLRDQPGVPMIAPSDPNVVYEVTLDETAAKKDIDALGSLRRSDDGGATWHALQAPTYNGQPLRTPQLRISPTDANMVFLQGGGSDVPSSQSVCDLGPPTVCFLTYISTDSGQHWKVLSLPVKGVLMGDTAFYGSPLLHMRNVEVQGDRIFLTVSYLEGSASSVNEVVRLVSSSDGGQTWQVADSTLRQQGVHVCSYVVDPTGSTMYAVTDPIAHNGRAVCQDVPDSVNALWQSDDGGAHWRYLNPGPTPAKYVTVLGIAPGAMGQPDTLLASPGGPALWVSVDDSASWQQLPMPTHFGGYPPFVNSLSDGTVIAPFSMTKSGGFAFFAWKAGWTAWRQVTPVFNVSDAGWGYGWGYALVQGSGTLPGAYLTFVTQSLGAPWWRSGANVYRCGLYFSGA